MKRTAGSCAAQRRAGKALCLRRTSASSKQSRVTIHSLSPMMSLGQTTRLQARVGHEGPCCCECRFAVEMIKASVVDETADFPRNSFSRPLQGHRQSTATLVVSVAGPSAPSAQAYDPFDDPFSQRPVGSGAVNDPFAGLSRSNMLLSCEHDCLLRELNPHSHGIHSTQLLQPTTVAA